MRLLCLRRSSLCKRVSSIIVISLMLTVFYFEVVEYYFADWHQLQCEKDGDCVKILLVADPQLIGLYNELISWLTPIAIWDSDRYVKKTYYFAKKFIDPDVVIFLGDLMDEGSYAKQKDFISYRDRFMKVFNHDRDYKIKYLFIPGDNDIGGEGMEPVKQAFVDRFEETYPTNAITHCKNLTFYKVNHFTRRIPALPRTALVNEDEVSVVISHMPILFKPSVFSEKVLSVIRPNLLFAAHEHSSMIVTSDNIVQVRQVEPVNPGDDIHRLYLKVGNTFEIIVPTCSYRMGTEKIGFGYALIENNEVQYTVLWSPSRFRQLFCYALATFLAFWIYVLNKCKNNRELRYSP